jgi:hypothetical protein
MIVFGVDVPLPEIMLIMSIITMIILLEAIIVVGMILKQLNKMKKASAPGIQPVSSEPNRQLFSK